MKCAYLSLPLLVLAACQAGEGSERVASVTTVVTDAVSAPASAWRANPEQGLEVRGGDAVVVETGPHAVLWPEGAPELRPPYTIRATFEKGAGRLHEGYGLLFGGRALEVAEAEQRYSYFLVRGDGSFLVKRRGDAGTTIVRDWMRNPGIQRDKEGQGQPNLLEVRVGREEVVFRVNQQEVVRVPAAELDVVGRPGIRVSHEVVLTVRDFEVTPGLPAANGTP